MSEGSSPQQQQQHLPAHTRSQWEPFGGDPGTARSVDRNEKLSDRAKNLRHDAAAAADDVSFE